MAQRQRHHALGLNRQARTQATSRALRTVLVSLALTASAWSASQNEVYAETTLLLSSPLSARYVIDLPTVGFTGLPCPTAEKNFLSEEQIASLEELYALTAEDTRPWIHASDSCLTFVAVDQARAYEIITSIVSGVRSLELLSIRQGYFGDHRSKLDVVQYPNILILDYVAAEKHNANDTVDPYLFGYLVFEFVPQESVLHVYRYGYMYEPAI